jgi:hypothetical protein
MRTNPFIVQVFVGALLANLLMAPVQPAAAQGTKNTMLPGAELLHKFPSDVYRIPLLLEAKDGPRLLVWVDAFDPAPKPKFPMDTLPSPVFDLIVWDVPAKTQVNKLAYPKENAPLSPLPAGMNFPGMASPFGTIALSPDGKQLAYLTRTSKMIPGKIIHETQTRIQLADLATRKVQLATSVNYKETFNTSLLFAPDGALLILHGKTCTIQELGKAKPRKEFPLVRSKFLPADPGAYSIYAVNDAAVSPDGKQMAVAADGMVHVYDLTTGKVLFQANPLFADPQGKTNAQSSNRVSLAFAPAKENTLLAVEIVTGPPKSSVVARVFDLKTKKETSRQTLAQEATKAAPFGGAAAPNWGRAYSYWNVKGQPRIIFDGKLFDVDNGKVLQQFNRGSDVIVSHDGKYLVRLTQKQGDKRFGVETWRLDAER